MQDKRINLCGIEYLVTEVDGQVIFQCNDGMSTTTIALEWTGCGWYIVDLRDYRGQVFAKHVVKAVEWVEKNYEIEWNDGVGTASLLH
jgi:hypothetical protein